MLESSVVDLSEISRRSGFAPEAFVFVQEGLQHTLKMIHGDAELTAEDLFDDDSRHVSGRQLCIGLRELAVHQFGGLARIVLSKWGIDSTEDFGRVVFALVDAGLLRKTDEDTLEDFRGVYDFADAFGPRA
ncbi:MAG: Minf_1886 family protein [Phycisphaerales bacterium]